ncbi:MAG: hypothetical protein LC772_09320 [Chloroflexi bacterium]|nr:hypothetical protein [Chloroflexota bacterium]
MYALTADARDQFSRAYMPLLSKLLEVMKDRLPAAEVERIPQEVGEGLAAAPPGAETPLEDRLEPVLALLTALDGLVELQERATAFRSDYRASAQE